MTCAGTSGQGIDLGDINNGELDDTEMKKQCAASQF
jgi:hypothetical protein